jgi:branched-chain amino acid transport system ATP-binding protein
VTAPSEAGSDTLPAGPSGSLVIEGLTRRFGGFAALDGVDLELAAGSILGLVGPNGSGKTTLINVVSGVYPPSGGTVRLDGRDVGGLRPHRLVHLGLNRTFQVPKPFASLSVEENLAVAAAHSRRGRPRRAEVLAEVGLDGLHDRPAGSLNASQQKRLDLARALTTNPSVLLVDELGAGLATEELGELAHYLRTLADDGITLLVVEHLLGFLEQLTDAVVVLSAGRRIFSGTLRDAVADPEVVRVFLGG